MNQHYQDVINAIKAFLPDSKIITPQDIEEQVDYALTNPRFKGKRIDRDLLIKELKSQYTMVMDTFRIIELDDPERRVPWVAQKKLDRARWKFWNRYRDYLMYKKGFAPPVIDELDTLTDRTLDGLYDPDANVGFDKKGLVVGQVQSGKTSNYTGLICKAADAGYNLLIVLSGTLNNLRSQTQLRIDEGFLGFDTQSQRAYDKGEHVIGVGKPKNTLPAHSLTDSSDNGDFTAKGANVGFVTGDPIIAVIKKNSGVLRKLYKWLHNHAQGEDGSKKILSKTLLLIDDEADNASINTKKKPDERTAINAGIRDILGLFAKSAYVGYTATPFANIFIPADEGTDLFPRDFIINIPPPPNYIGPEKIFGFDYYDDDERPDTVLPLCFRIDDTNESKRELAAWTPGSHKVNGEIVEVYKKDTPPDELPPSLERAIRCFIITCAIRKLRGQNKAHNSMLVHIARLVKWHNQITGIVEHTFNKYRTGIDQNQPQILKLLRETFEQDAGSYLSYPTVTKRILASPLAGIDAHMQVHTWEDVAPFLWEAVVNMTVREINGGSKETLDYYENAANGISVIAVGGDKLSRGLTLEGLSVSYFLRASKMYDTLMQMGRWFGYRNGYTDLCRLFTTGELNEWFCHITRATQELREEFDYMSEVAGASPNKFTLKVRSHPGVLQITASNKIRSGVPLAISWAGRLVESYELIKDKEINRRNLDAIKRLVKNLKAVSEPVIKTGNTQVWYDVSPDEIITWLERIKIFENLKAYNPENLIRFINAQVKRGALMKWRVALTSKKDAHTQTDVAGYRIGNFVRNEATESQEQGKFFIRKSHIIDKKHEAIDLGSDQIKEALKKTIQLWEKEKKGKEPKSASGQVIRNHFRSKENPLLLLYLIDAVESTSDSKERLDWDTPLIGYAISFPGDPDALPVEFTANNTLLPYYNQDDNTLDYSDEED
jgi:hypothetical protein